MIEHGSGWVWPPPSETVTWLCRYVNCLNEARYIDDTGTFCCGLCPIRANRSSLKLIYLRDLVALRLPTGKSIFSLTDEEWSQHNREAFVAYFVAGVRLPSDP